MTDGASADLDCDGKIESRYDFVESSSNDFNASTPLNVCTTNSQCDCLAPLTFYTGYKGIDSSTGRALAETTTVFYDLEKAPPPCAMASTDVIALLIVGPEADCRLHTSVGGGRINVVVRKVCK